MSFFTGVLLIFVLTLCVSAGVVLLFTSGIAKYPQLTGQTSNSPAATGNPPATEGSPAANINDQYIMVVGDSIVVGATPELKKHLTHVSIDAKVGRTMPTGYDILESREQEGLLQDANVIVVSLANNIANDSIEKAQDIIGLVRPGQRLVFVTGHGHANMKPINDFLRTLPDEYGWVTVADWDQAISQNAEWLGPDGVHVANNKANILYADLVTNAIQLVLAKPAAS